MPRALVVGDVMSDVLVRLDEPFARGSDAARAHRRAARRLGGELCGVAGARGRRGGFLSPASGRAMSSG